MADAGKDCETGDLCRRISRTDKKRRRALLPLCHLERSVLRGVCAPGSRRLRGLLRPIWTDRPAGPDDYPDRAEARLLFPVALCLALVAPPVARDSSTSDRPGRGDHRVAPSSLSLGRRRKELAA